MNTNFRVLVVDDEEVSRLSLKKLLEENFPDIEVAGEAGDVPSAVKQIHKQKPDVVFLDIDMPGHSGLQLPDFFPENEVPCKIVFVTALTDFALTAFELSAIDYIVKPPSVEQIARALKKITPFSAMKHKALRDNLQDAVLQKIAIQTSEGLHFVLLNDILFLKADGSYTHFHLSSGKRFTVSKKLTEFTRLEKTGEFMRIHRSHIINLNQIAKVERGSTPAVTMTDGETLSIAMERKHALFNYLEGFKI